MYTCQNINTIKIINIIITPKSFFKILCYLLPLLQPSPHRVLGQPLLYFLSLWISLYFVQFNIDEIMQCVLLFWTDTSFSIISLKFIHVVRYINSLFLLMLNSVNSVRICHYFLFIYLFMDQVEYIPAFDTTSKAAVNLVCRSLCMSTCLHFPCYN